MRKNNIIGLLSSLLSLAALGLTGCENSKNKKNESFFNSNTSEYVLADSYSIKNDDDINFKSSVVIDLNNKTLDLNKKSLVLNSKTDSITIKNGTLKNGSISLSTTSGKINFENVVIDSSVENEFSGAVTFDNVIANNLYLNGGSISINSGTNYSSVSKINNIYSSVEAIYESIVVSRNSVVGNIYSKSSNQISVYGTVANIVLDGDGSFVTAYDYSNIKAIYANAKYLVVDYKDNANVVNSYISADADNTDISYNVSYESAISFNVPEYYINEVLNLCTEIHPTVSYSYTENDIVKVDTIETVKLHSYSESKTIIEKNYITGGLVEYTCEDCGSHIRELEKADRSVSDCDNFLEFALLYLPDFNIDFTIDDKTNLVLGGKKMTVNDGYVHILSNKGSLNGAIVLDAIVGDDENATEEVYKYYLVNSKCYILEASNYGKINQNIKLITEIDAYEDVATFISSYFGCETDEEIQSFIGTLNTYFNYLQAGANIVDVLIANGDDISKLIVGALKNLYGIVVPEELLVNINYEELLFDYDKQTGIYSLDFTNVTDLLEQSVEEVIESIYGEGTTDKVIDFISEDLTNMTVSEIANTIVEFAKLNKIDSDKLFSIVDTIVSNVIGREFDVYEAIQTHGNVSLKSLEGVDEVDAILAFVSKTNLEHLVDTRFYEVYDLVYGNKEEAKSYHDIKQDLIKMNAKLDLNYSIDANSFVETFNFNLNQINEVVKPVGEGDTQEEVFTEYAVEYTALALSYDNSEAKELYKVEVRSSDEGEAQVVLDASLVEDAMKFDVNLSSYLPYQIKFGYDASITNNKEAYLDFEIPQCAFEIKYADNETTGTTFNADAIFKAQEEGKEDTTVKLVDYSKTSEETLLDVDLECFGLFTANYLANSETETAIVQLTNKIYATYGKDVVTGDFDAVLNTIYNTYEDDEKKEVYYPSLIVTLDKEGNDYNAKLASRFYNRTKKVIEDDTVIEASKKVENNKTTYLASLTESGDTHTNDISFSYIEEVKDTCTSYALTLNYNKHNFSDPNDNTVTTTYDDIEKANLFIGYDSNEEGLDNIKFNFDHFSSESETEPGKETDLKIEDDSKFNFELNKSDYSVFGYIINADVDVPFVELEINQEEVLEESTNETRVDTDFDIKIKSKDIVTLLDGSEKISNSLEFTYAERYETYEENNITKGIVLHDYSVDYFKTGFTTNGSRDYYVQNNQVTKINASINESYEENDIKYNLNFAYEWSEIDRNKIVYTDSTKTKILSVDSIDDNEKDDFTLKDNVVYECLRYGYYLNGYVTNNKTYASLKALDYDFDERTLKDFFATLNSNPQGEYAVVETNNTNPFRTAYHVNYIATGGFKQFAIPHSDSAVDGKDDIEDEFILETNFQRENNVINKLDFALYSYNYRSYALKVQNPFNVSRISATALTYFVNINLDFTNKNDLSFSYETGDDKSLQEYHSYDISFDDKGNQIDTYLGTTKFNTTKLTFNGNMEDGDYNVKLNQYISYYTYPEGTYDATKATSQDYLIKPTDLLVDESTIIDNAELVVSKHKLSFTRKETNNNIFDTDEYSGLMKKIGHTLVKDDELGNVINSGFAKTNLSIETTDKDEKTKLIHFHSLSFDADHYDETLTDKERMPDILDVYAEITSYKDSETNECEYGLYVYVEENQVYGNSVINNPNFIYHRDWINVRFSNTEELAMFIVNNSEELEEMLEMIGIHDTNSIGIEVDKTTKDTYKFYLVIDGKEYAKFNIFNLYITEDTLKISIVEIPSLFSNDTSIKSQNVGIDITLSKANENLTLTVAMDNSYLKATATINIDKNNIITANLFNDDLIYGFRVDLFSNRAIETFENVFDMTKEEFIDILNNEEQKQQVTD